MNKDDHRHRLYADLATWLGVALAAVYVLWATVAADYDEGGILVMLLILAALAMCLSWKTKFRKIRMALTGLLAVALIGTGLLFVEIGQYRSRVERVTAAHLLASVGQALELGIADGWDLPDCDWRCMSRQLTKREYWKPISVPYAGHNQAVNIDQIPFKDGWGCRYAYTRLSDNRFVLKSSGPDRRFFTDDDLIYLMGNPLLKSLLPIPILFE